MGCEKCVCAKCPHGMNELCADCNYCSFWLYKYIPSIASCRGEQPKKFCVVNNVFGEENAGEIIDIFRSQDFDLMLEYICEDKWSKFLKT